MGGGSEVNIAAMLDAHYSGEINIAEYWAVGDVRTVSINAIESLTIDVTNSLESQSAQDIELVIIGMNHDDKADGAGKTAVTVQTRDQLGTAGCMNVHYMALNYSLWSSSNRRTWCNGKFKSALPTWLQNLIKSVSKVSNRHSKYSVNGQHSTTDDVFLLSEFEILGTAGINVSSYGNIGSDGTQYEYMKTESNRMKDGPASYWWTRSALLTVERDEYISSFIVVNKAGASSGSSGASATNGIAPAFCL